MRLIKADSVLMLKLIVFDYKIDSTLANFFTQNVASYFPGLESIDSKFF